MRLPTSDCCHAPAYRDSLDAGIYCSACDSPLDREGRESETPARVYRARDLRVDYNGYGGHSVEFSGEVLAGPYAAKIDAQRAKRELVAGVPLSQPSDGSFR